MSSFAAPDLLTPKLPITDVLATDASTFDAQVAEFSTTKPSTSERSPVDASTPSFSTPDAQASELPTRKPSTFESPPVDDSPPNVPDPADLLGTAPPSIDLSATNLLPILNVRSSQVPQQLDPTLNQAKNE